jgi:hypothetical protein
MKHAMPALLALAALAAAGSATAEELLLGPRLRPGDAYALSLAATTDTDTASPTGKSGFRENVRVAYAATVVVLETDAGGRPTRERHEAVRLTYDRPDGAGSLFRDGASFEVRREGDGMQLFAAGERIDRRVEALVGALLETQFERGLGPVLFEPGRPVAVGETWPLDASLARRFLRERGFRVVELGAPATATLERQADELVVRFAIPIAWLELDGMPANARASESDARFEGTIRLAADPSSRPTIYASRLALRVDGVVTAPRFARAVPWTLERSTLSDQRTLRMATRDVARY